MLCGIQLKVDMGVGDKPTRFVGIFSKRPHPGSKVIQAGVKILFFLRGLLLGKKPPSVNLRGLFGDLRPGGQSTLFLVSVYHAGFKM